MTADTDNGLENQVTEEELKLYLRLKPYILRCLSLNHDINNPLAGIVGYCEFLLEDLENLTKDQVSYVKQIATCAERIKNEVESLCLDKIKLGEDVDFAAATEFYEKLTAKASD